MIIKARNLSKKVIFNGEEINILDKIDLDISSNTSLAVVGPSGSGKSTLLGLLAGLDSPSGGEIFFDDMPLHSMSEDSRSKIRKESVAFVFQNFELLAGLTALENVMLPLEMKNNGRAKEIAEKYYQVNCQVVNSKELLLLEHLHAKQRFCFAMSQPET